MSDELLEAIRRLPDRLRASHVGKEHILLKTYFEERPNGLVYCEELESFEVNCYFYYSDLSELADALEGRDIEVPYYLLPCTSQQLKAPDAEELLHTECEQQGAPEEWEERYDAADLQQALDTWFAEHSQAWIAPEKKRVIVLLPSERCELYALIFGEECPTPEP